MDGPATPTPNATPLDYAPRPAWHRRQTGRRVGRLLIVVFVALAGWRWGPLAWRAGQIWYWQRQCLRYTASPDEVVFESDGKGTTTDRSPECVKKLAAAMGKPLASGGPTVVFVHEMRTPKGERRLVVVLDALPPVGMLVLPLRPGRFGQPPAPPSGGTLSGGTINLKAASIKDRSLPTMTGASNMRPGSHLRVFAGQPDAADPAHFTIGYEVDGKRGIVDGWLNEGGNGVKLRAQGGPRAEFVLEWELDFQ